MMKKKDKKLGLVMTDLDTANVSNDESPSSSESGQTTKLFTFEKYMNSCVRALVLRDSTDYDVEIFKIEGPLSPYIII